MTYPGGKEGAGVFQRIICQIPPHSVYIEPFAGGAAILRHKRPALASIAMDIDPRAAAELALLEIPGLTVLRGDALRLLRTYRCTGDEFIYIDPPYLMTTRKSGAIYRHEFGQPAEHCELLQIIKQTPAIIAISGYPSRMYDAILKDWRSITFQATTRSGKTATEQLWMNYPEPAQLHDYRYLGEGYRERERIKRKTNRWRARLSAMPATERYAMLHALEDLTNNAGDTTRQGETQKQKEQP